MLPMRVTESPYDLTPVVDSRRLSGQCPRNVNRHESALGEQKSVLTGASGNTDNLTGVVDVQSVCAGRTRHIYGDKAPLSEKKAMECAPVTGEGTDDVAVIVDPKRSSQDGTRNGDAGEPSLRQEKCVVADSVAEVPDDLARVVDSKS